MRTARLPLLLILLPLVLVFLSPIQASAIEPTEAQLRQSAKTAQASGNFKDAYDQYRKLTLRPQTEPKLVGNDLRQALNCLSRLGRINETDAYLETVIRTHTNNWRLLSAAAESYMSAQHHGFLIAGEFQRGHHRGGGHRVTSVERDRVRALQLMTDAMAKIPEEDKNAKLFDFYFTFARYLITNRDHRQARRLQYLTDIDKLPDYIEGYHYQSGGQGAPVDADGKPVFHEAPKRFEDAKTDGERWRWALQQAAEQAPERRNDVLMRRANFLYQQFGVQTMASYGHFFARQQTNEDNQDESGTYALHTLSENETIAQLATGIKRFNLPDDHNHIKIYQQVAKENNRAKSALIQLGSLFQNRRQYPRAAEIYREMIRRYQTAPRDLRQIEANWGRFENVMTQPADQGATIDYRYRNGNKVRFKAQRIDIEKLLTDVKAYLKSNPKQIDGSKTNIGNLGHRLVTQNEKQYLEEQTAAWELELEPRKNHFDRRITVTTPLQKAGAYLLSAKMDNGNEDKIVVWISDTAIVQKPLDGKTFYFIADARNGKPIPRANLEFFGWTRLRSTKRNPRDFQIHTRNFAELSDANGQVFVNAKAQPRNYQWLAIARTDQGRLAYLGFSHIWHARRHDERLQQAKTFIITDRPVYRPKQTVEFKAWIRQAQYDHKDQSLYANLNAKLRITNAKGDKLLEQTVTTDQFGGIAGKLSLPADAMLGVYSIQIEARKDKSRVRGFGSFRVEEYKKPEFEVSVEAPTEPVMLGEKIIATVKAKYYFGSPVTNAKVKYKILRSSHSDTWYPVARWDWLYGRGYWWFAYDYPWYPGWRDWGCVAPSPWWFPTRHSPPEVIAEREMRIGPDGTVNIEIDTLPAKEIHGNQDHKYDITVEVVDASRRTIVGTGSVLVARKPFKVFSWVDRGHYRKGDTVRASFQAQTLDKKPVEGTGVLKLLRITYDKKRKPIETLEQQWDLDTNAQGHAEQQIHAARAGQYRLAYTVTDKQKHTIEGGYVFTVRGDRPGSEDFRFNSIELVADRQQYAPGEKVNLLVNTNRSDSTVLLFVRPAGSIYLAPKVLRLQGKSLAHEIEVMQKDMPNFFIEAVTVSGAKIHSVTREIVVPPEKRVLDIAIQPSAKEYKPGEKAKIELQVTDENGKPAANTSTVLAVYDKSLEYISGGSNVPEIKAFFWKWRRSHYSQGQTNLQRRTYPISFQRKDRMNNLGIFGETVADELTNDVVEDKDFDSVASGRRRGGFGTGGFGGGAPGGGGPAPAAEMAMADGADARVLRAPLLGTIKSKPTPTPGTSAELVQPTVRTKFADTAFWIATLATDEKGRAHVEFDMPENLSAWKIRAWGMNHGTRVGESTTEVVTRKNLILRMQAPRFFVEKDEVVLSANVHNYLKTKKTVQVSLDVDAKLLSLMSESVQSVEIAAGEEARVDWRVKVIQEGEAFVRMKAITNEESDAMEMKFPVYVHGMLKTESYSGALRGEDKRGQFTIRIPSERRKELSRLEARYSPTLAGAMVDALPYLSSYPYGCTEQTLNRFLPTVITQKVLLDMGLDLDAIRKKRANLNAQEIGDDQKRAKQWKHFKHNAVFDTAEVRKMTKAGVNRLTDMQLADGGWGWFSGYGEKSTPHTTAYVVHGLQIAKANDVAIVPGILEDGTAWLKRHQDHQLQLLKNHATKTKPYKTQADNLDAFVYMVLVDAGIQSDAMRDFLYRDRVHLAVYTKAMFGLALHKQNETKKLAMVLENIAQFVVEDDENQTAHLRMPANNLWWYWYGSEFESHAYYLKLLAKTDPKGRVASRIAKYLINNRKHATYWNSTRDTALCIEALAEFLKASGESKPEMTVEIWMDGQHQKTVEITSKNLFTFDNKFVLTGDALESGPHMIEFRKQGTGPLYYNGYVTNFTLEDPITKAGLEIKVNRKYYKLRPVDKTIKAAGSRGQAVDQKVEKFEREELPNLATLKSGDLVEIELTIDSKNDYEYILFEDMKAAGFEPVDLRSGYGGNDMGAYMELRDNRVSFFVSRLMRGKHSLSYRMRAEIPGKFSALPTRAEAMYAPELKANSDEIKLKIIDKD